MFLAEHREAIGADLVRHVAVPGDAVRADNGEVDHIVVHEIAGHVVRDQRAGDLLLHELPRGQTRALEHRTGLVDVDVDLFPFFHCGTHHAFGGPVACRGDRTGIAVRDDIVVVGHEYRAVDANPLVRLRCPRPACAGIPRTSRASDGVKIPCPCSPVRTS